MEDDARLLLGALQDQRNHVLGIVDGLSETDLRRPVAPSGWSCLSLVQHLTIDDERFWFQAVVAGDSTAIDDVVRGTTPGWTLPPDVSPGSVLAAYRQQALATNDVVNSTELGASPAWWPDFFGEWRLTTMREVLLHVVTETAAHAGHLDVVRELIDRRQWIVLG